ncbi:MAG: diaminopimelate epimerase [Fervidobacterium sp.]|nr:diaminopimelate epimerase [Fervidobacterium sp.]
MKLEKYNATGNTFIVVDCINEKLNDLEKSATVLNCVEDRDGVIFVEKTGNTYHMDYFNRDGKRATFCGNGARTFVTYLMEFYNIDGDIIFSTNAGMLKAKASNSLHIVSVQMPSPVYKNMIEYNGFIGVLVEVGVPHILVKSPNVDFIELEKIGPEMRRKFNANVNFFEVIREKVLKIRTYERGVERETLSCGSGVTAAAYYYKFFILEDSSVPDKVEIHARGGILNVLFSDKDIFLEGGVLHE